MSRLDFDPAALEFDPGLWSNAADSDAAKHAREESERCLAAYSAKPSLVREHANIERATAQGGYGHRQLYELIQNGADELVDQPGGRIKVVLTEDNLYCANEGSPIEVDGVEAILSSHVSMKRGTEIGRFGLGFKSVLGVSNTPQFFSRSACFGFDAAEADRLIRQVVPGAERAPVLRTANPLDPLAAAELDQTLRELMSWATTVVRLPRNVGDSSWLSEDLAGFPAEFLLFSPHVGSLVLEDRTRGEERVLSVGIDGQTYRLVDEAGTSEWKVFKTLHRPSPDARADAGELSDREVLPLIWAVPMRGRRQRGSFWAFFPTEYETTLSGILNAPWKTNEDRQNLLQGVFNDELIDAFVGLVVDHLNDLVDPSEPARFLDYLPGRIEEAKNWADRRLTLEVYRRAEQRPSLPDQHGRLRLPAELSLHPMKTTERARQAWAAYANRPTSWCHHSVSPRERWPRAQRLLGNRQWAVANLRVWLEALAEDGSVDASAAAISVAEALLDELNPVDREEARPARIVLTDEGNLVAASPSHVFLPGEYNVSAKLVFVHSGLAARPETVAALQKLGVGRVDAARELEAFVARGLFSGVKWEEFWRLAGLVPTDRATTILSKRPSAAAPLHVRSVTGDFVPIELALLPGKIVPGDGSRDGGVAVDTTFHEASLELLRYLGVDEVPKAGGGSPTEPWFAEYRRMADTLYEQALRGRRGRPHAGYIVFDQSAFLGPLSSLLRLGDEGKERFTAAVLGSQDSFLPWTLAHETRRDTYPIVPVESPVLWFIRKHGRVRSSLGIVSLSVAVGRDLSEWSELLPVVQLSHSLIAKLGLANDLGPLTEEQWQFAFSRLEDNSELGDEALGRFYAATARTGREPVQRVRCRSGTDRISVEPGSATVVSNRHHFQVLADLGVPCLLCSPEDADVLVERWGLRPPSGLVSTEVDAIPNMAETPIVDEFPALRSELDGTGIILVRCSVVRLVTVTQEGTTSHVVPHYLRDKRFYWSDEGGDAALLDALSDALGLDFTESDIRGALDHRDNQSRVRLLHRVSAAEDLPTRLLALTGSEALRRHLPADLVESVERLRGTVGDKEVAELVLAVHGVDTLKALASDLEVSGLEAPRHWAGSKAALAFVRDLQFPREFAGFEGARRPPLLEVEGPVELNPLHEFQQRVSDCIKALLGSEDSSRGLLSLPTGAGKTRVAVQSLIEAIKDQGLRSPILWVAETDELCEQAVQTWADVWRAIGPRAQLRISRLWTANEAEPVESGAHVVVATISKLGHSIPKARYEWLSNPSVVVVDEAHGSTTTSYTALLNWLDLGRGRQGRPLIGLTATPFRGRSESSAEQLAARYGRRRLDAGAFEGDPYPVLQEMGVLARVRHHVLGGIEIELSAAELELLRQTRRLPPAVEEQLGVNVDRNRALLHSILSLPEDWTTLVFATSVTHAQTLAAMLSLEGVPARVISAKTEPAARRHYVAEFRAGRIRVLTNYAVLTEGFDAPAVRAVYVARPTFSPNLYQQMVGRGLRGPLNGGKEECLIVDVADNIVQYGGELAFRGFDYLWDSGAHGATG